MPINNAFRNFGSTTLTPASGSAIVVTSVRNIAPTDGTTRTQYGADDDTQFTLTVFGPDRCEGVIEFYDSKEANKFVGKAGTLTFTQTNVVAGASAASNYTITNVTFSKVIERGEPWGEISIHRLRFSGGSVAVANV